MAGLTMNQFTHSNYNVSKEIVFTAKIGSRRGGTKKQEGWRKMMGKTPTQILIWEFPILGGTSNVHNVLSDYIDLRESLPFRINRVFLRANPKSVVLEKIVMGMHFGKNDHGSFVQSDDDSVTFGC